MLEYIFNYIFNYNKCNIILSFDIVKKDKIYCNNYCKKNDICEYHKKLRKLEWNNYHLVNDKKVHDLDTSVIAEHELLLRSIFSRKYYNNVVNDNHLAFENLLQKIIDKEICYECEQIIFPFKKLYNRKKQIRCLECKTVRNKTNLEIFTDSYNYNLDFIKYLKRINYLDLEYSNRKQKYIDGFYKDEYSKFNYLNLMFKRRYLIIKYD